MRRRSMPPTWSLKFMKTDRQGVSPVISTMLIMVIMLALIIAIINWGQPTITSIETGVQHRTTMEYMDRLDARFEGLIASGEGASAPAGISGPGASVLAADGSGSSTSTQFTSRVEVFDRSSTMVVMAVYGDYDLSISNFSSLSSMGLSMTGQTKRSLIGNQMIINMTSHGMFNDPGSSESSAVVGTASLVEDVFTDTFSTVLTNLDLGAPYIDLQISTDQGEHIADAYMFAIGSVSVKLVAPSNTYTMKCMNTMVLSDYPSQVHVENPPLVLKSPDGNMVTLYAVQMAPTGTAIGGPGAYNINLTVADTDIILKEQVSHIRIIVTGKEASVVYGAYSDMLGSSAATPVEVDPVNGLVYWFPKTTGDGPTESPGGTVVLGREAFMVHLESDA